jgi:hypothetical protein
MSTDTTEKGLEACIERYLTGGVSGAPVKEGVMQEQPKDYGRSRKRRLQRAGGRECR